MRGSKYLCADDELDYAVSVHLQKQLVIAQLGCHGHAVSSTCLVLP